MSVQTIGKMKSHRSSSNLETYRALLGRYLGPQWPRVLLLAILLLAGIAVQLANPQVIRYFLDTAQAGGLGRTLVIAALAYIGFALAQQGMSLAAYYASGMLSWTATNRLRTDLTLHCLRLDMGFHKRRTPGEMIERIDGDVTQLANFFSQLVIEVLGNGLLVIGILVMLFLEDARLGLGMAVYSAITLLILGAIQRLAVMRWATARQAIAEENGFLEERISGAEEIRASGAETHTLNRFYGLLRNILVRLRAAFVVSQLAYNLTDLVYVIGFSIGLALSVYLYTQGQATLGSAYMIVFYVGMLSEPLQSIRRQVQDLQQATASILRIQELFALRPAVTEPAGAPQRDDPVPFKPLPVTFEGVSFRYEDSDQPDGAPDPATENVLADVTFQLEAGRVLGILGRTGSGKTTLSRLLFRLYDPTAGSIHLGGLDLREMSLAELRRQVGLVTQDVQLFQASVRDNLTFFDPRVPDSQIEAILDELRLMDWVRGLPGGLNALLGSDGQGLSAGEAQLLAFARVFLKRPGLVVLDEASSRLDPATEARMERAIDRLFAGRTGIVIAHRLKTVQRADAILILEGGRVAEFGPRAALAADPGSRFYHLLQTGLEEVMA